MIIVEGPDGSGKTTLINQLGYERRHFRALRAGRGADGNKKQGWGAGDEAPIAYARQIFKATEDEHGNHHIAFDRFHVSEQVYGPMLRGESGISNEEARVLRRLLYSRGIPVIVCRPPFEIALRNMTKEGRERPVYQTEDFLRRSRDGFIHVAERDGYLVYDYTEHLARHQPGPVPAWIYGRSFRTCPPSVVGSPTARYLIIGEKSNLPLDLPFFSMERSSGYLNRALWYAGFREEEIAFTNALTSDGRPRDLRACLLASTEFIIALGVKAGSILGEQELPATLPILTAPHPQFWQRFHAADPEGYVSRLKEIREATK